MDSVSIIIGVFQQDIYRTNLLYPASMISSSFKAAGIRYKVNYTASKHFVRKSLDSIISTIYPRWVFICKKCILP